MENKMFVRASEVASDFGVSEGMAYRMIKRLNKELEEKGFLTVAGRVSRQYYLERTYGLSMKTAEEVCGDGEQ